MSAAAAAGSAAAGETDAKRAKKPVRVWCDGCFDMMHFGHANALRQAKAMGDVLVVGVHNDDEIRKNKGPPVMTAAERYRAVRACKWVDEVVEDAPYTTSLEWLDKYNCDFCVHGDDVTCTADGQDAYHLAKAVGRYKEYQRTQGVSSTDLVGRMLLLTKTHHETDDEDTSKAAVFSPYTTGVSKFLPTTQRILQFSTRREPKPGDVIGYMPGAFDLFHVGHIDGLEAARKKCDYLVVGLHSDKVANNNHGGNFPIMNLHERTLSVLSCRYVDEVVIGAPAMITKEVVEYFNISKVFHGSTEIKLLPGGGNPYEYAIKNDMYVKIESGTDLTTEKIVSRIISNRAEFQARNAKKAAKENATIEALAKAEAAKKA